MLFNSLEFICFFPIAAIGFFLIPQRFRWAWLLAASYCFYMGWNAAYALLLLTTTVVTWLSGLGIERSDTKKAKKIWLTACLVINLGTLFTFKYCNFFLDNLYGLYDWLHISYTPVAVSLVLPVGISFFTFQAIGYSIDVYRGEISAQKHFGKYALFVSFFPQLVAGPIERSRNLLPQFEEEHHFNYDDAASGLRLMAWGYFKKIVIADTLCVSVNTVYNNLHEFHGLSLIIATLFFTFQVFCDFSGYSDIAQGCARIMGFRLMKNFDHPYFSVSIKEFWRKWHISLSTWLKDYVYIPLGGNRRGKARTDVNLLTTFLVSGLWHGADWSFVLWGGIHAVVQVLESHTLKLRDKIAGWIRLSRAPRLRRAVQMLFTFLIVSFAWIFFRANTMQDAMYVITHMFPIGDLSFNGIYTMLKMMFSTRAEFYRLLLTLPVFLAASFADWKWSLEKIITERKTVIRFCIYVIIVVYILLSARADMQDFIYFQF